MTITPSVIEKARSLVVLLAGMEKAPMLSRTLTGPLVPDQLPAQLARRGTWIVDHAAASGMLNP